MYIGDVQTKGNPGARTSNGHQANDPKVSLCPNKQMSVHFDQTSVRFNRFDGQSMSVSGCRTKSFCQRKMLDSLSSPAAPHLPSFAHASRLWRGPEASRGDQRQTTPSTSHSSRI